MAEQHGLTASGLNEALDATVSQQAAARRKGGRPKQVRGRPMTAEQAQRTASDLQDYDSRIKGGRLAEA